MKVTVLWRSEKMSLLKLTVQKSVIENYNYLRCQEIAGMQDFRPFTSESLVALSVLIPP
jgi:hypothetical protein